MSARRRSGALASALVLFLALGVNLWRLGAVPFHPDESTWIYMARDLPHLLHAGAGALCWTPSSASDPATLERARTAPLPRHILGLARAVGLIPEDAVPVDWDWAAPWAENAARGAVPSAAVLLTARLPMAILNAMSAWLIFLIARRVGGAWTGWAAALLFVTNALMLVHGRRAMSEAALVSAVCLAIWVLLRARRQPWLVGSTVALAVLAKHTGAIVGVPAVMALFWPADGARLNAARAARALALAALAFFVVFFLLSPNLWCDPVRGVAAMLEGRTGLVDAQVEALRAAGGQFVIDTPGDRVTALIDRVFVAGPVFWELPNYSEQTAETEAAYLAWPLANLLRGPVWGFLMLTLALLGAGVGALLILRGERAAGLRRDLAILLLWTVTSVAALLALVPLAWQRYYLPLVPAVCLWQAYALAHLGRAVGLARARRSS